MQPNVSFGSGTNLLGAPASNVLGMPGGTMQQTPSSAGYTPGVLPGQSPTPQGLPQAPQVQSIGAPGPVSQPLPQPGMGQPQGTVGMPPQVPETMMILKALIERQKLLGKHEEHIRNTILPPQNAQGGQLGGYTQ